MSKPDPDALAEAFAVLPKPLARCPMGRILDDATPAARGNIQAALDADRREVSTHWILTRLQSVGIAMNKDTVSRHRSGSCRCT